jgi:uncharacterized damage-inducible protein DinB
MARTTLQPVASLLESLGEAYDAKSWHGPTLRGALRGVRVEQAVRRPAPGRHNIRELAIHCAYWKYAARRQLTGDVLARFPLAGSNWFPRDDADPAAWKRELAVLADQHRQLRDAVERLTARDLAARAPRSKYTRGFILRGAIAHDLYHAGQIQLLKRLTA